MRIVSFGYSVPFPGIPHAGGEYYLRHIRALVDLGHEVMIVVPEDPANKAALDRSDLPARTVVVPVDAGPVAAARSVLQSKLLPARGPVRLFDNALKDPSVLAAVRAADLLEYQWTPVALLHKTVAGLLPRKVPAVCVAHDALIQLYDRQAEQKDGAWPRKLVRRIRSRSVRFDEKRILARMDHVLTLTAKDVDLINSLRPGVPASVISPPLEPLDPRWSLPRSPTAGNVLFVGAFDRYQNADAAVWLMKEIWPAVVRRAPHARLHLVGAHPTEEMRSLAERSSSVTVTGYVNDLVPHYLAASVAMIPLLTGTGVKFKTIEAMLWGVPVVATSIGIEGIASPGSGVFAAVADDADGLADGLVRVLTDPPGAADIATAARAFAAERYASAAFRGELDRVYSALVSQVNRGH